MDAQLYSVYLFGEGYGPKIQKGGNYRNDISFRLFDIYIEDQNNPLGGWWLEPGNMQEVADKINIKTTDIKPEIDEATNVTILKSTIETDMTPDVFTELARKVEQIRSSYVK